MNKEVSQAQEGLGLSEISERIDKKAALIADIRRTIDAQDIPFLTDPPEVIQREEDEFKHFFERVCDEFPDDEEPYMMKMHLLDKKKDAQSKDGLRNIAVQLQKLSYEHPDIAFLHMIDTGMLGLIDRRKRIREFQEEFGEPDPDGFYEKDFLEMFGDLEDLPDDIHEHITDVQVTSFSVNIFIDSVRFDDIEGYRQEGADVVSGIHLENNSLFNVIRDFRSEAEDAIGIPASAMQDDLDETVMHEEFHSIEDAFWNQNLDFVTAKKNVNKKLKRILRKQAEFMSIFGSHKVQDSVDLSSIGDASHEELLAEMYAKNRRSDVPNATYAVHLDQKNIFIEDVLKTCSQFGIRIEGERISIISTEELNEKIKYLYERVDGLIPGKRDEVDALFAFIPVSQFSLIERTVDRWIREG